MKKFYLKILLLFVLTTVGYNNLYAQYTASDLETGLQNAALAKDASGNIYTTRAKAGGGYEIAKYTNGSGTATVIYNQIAGNSDDLPYGLAVSGNGDIYFSSDMTNTNGKITRLNASSSYAATIVQSGRYFTGLAFDSQGRLCALEYKLGTPNTYSVVRYDNPSVVSPTNTTTPGTVLYGNIKVGTGLSYPSSISIATNGSIYFNSVFDINGSNPDKGGIVKLTTTNGINYTKSDINTTNYTSALFIDEFNNLYAIESLLDAPYKLYKYTNASGTPAEFYSATFSAGYPYLAYGLTAHNNTVYAIDGDNGSNGSRLLKLTPTDVTPPAVPTGLTATIAGGSRINLTWNANSDVDLNGYRIYGGTTTNPTTLIASIAKGTTTTAHTALTTGTQYFYRITAVDNAFNQSAFSSNINATPQKPTITSATYNASTGVLSVTGTNFLSVAGAANDISTTKFTLTAEGNITRTLTTSNVEIINASSFSVTLNNADKDALARYANKNGTTSTGGTTYNLAAAEDWALGEEASVVIAQTTIPLTISDVPTPTIASATYNASTGALVVTGTGLLSINGLTNDIATNKLSLTGEGGSSYTFTSANVEIASSTLFTITLNAIDKQSINQILNKNGLSSTSGTTYNLAAAEDWNSGADATIVIADLTGNAVTVSNVATPAIVSATYDYAAGILNVTATNLLPKSGSNNDIVVSKLKILGDANTEVTLTTPDVDIVSSTNFVVTLNSVDKTAINAILNKNGNSSQMGTTYNLNAMEDWNAGADAAVVIVDASGNTITVSNYDPVLPVNLMSLNYSKNNNAVVLNWATDGEYNSGEFRLGKSIDQGVTFQNLATIKAAGNSSSKLNYSFADKNPFVGTAYYKLTQVDQNNTTTLEKVIAVNFVINNADLVIYPNPTIDVIKFNDNRYKKAELSDLNGKKLASYTLTGTDHTLNVSNLPSGVYLLKLTSANGQVTKKIVKR
jgi:hypothetical protein